jgi:hypothetical protein
MNVSGQQLQKKFKHATDFGVVGTGTKINLVRFEAALREHLLGEDTLHIDGLYRGQAAILHVDPNTSLAVITDPTEDFISGWRLSPQQLEYALTQAKLGGG